ncbi:transglutaminase domain-containing protein [Zhihengliuella sp. ISTPL4]|uniref:transglutaminase domain-containing protein n=1 Tax=Zhihengliuella sp. ISTPL4 TaxID=2058657 RepID=UPI002570ACA6|nr:transglutaminase domain-containing protein [Zhihengliuella sp. ISTPL4]
MVLFSVLGGVAAVALVAGGIVVVNNLTGGGFGGSSEPVEAGGYLWEPVTYLKPDEHLEIPFDVDPEALVPADETGKPAYGVIDVYLNDELTIMPESSMVFWHDGDRNVEVSVLDNDKYKWSSESETAIASGFTSEDLRISSRGEADVATMWTEMARYYVVQRFDKDGKKLDIPIVHTVEAADEEDILHDPIELKTSVGEAPGSVQLSWDEPEGMSGDFTYYIIKTQASDYLDNGEFTGERTILYPEVIAETTETSWESKAVLDYEENSVANRELALYTYDSADELNFGSASGLDVVRSKSDLAVIAVANDLSERTLMSLKEVKDEIGSFPYEKAFWQARDLFPVDAGDLTTLPTWYPITTLDGDTAKMGVRIDIDAIEVKYEDFWYLDGRGAWYARMPFTVLGTKMSDSITAVMPDGVSQADWLAQSIANAKAYNHRAETEVLPTGDDTIVQDPTMSLDAFADMQAVVEVPDSEYEAYGSNEFSTFLAGHMVAGTRLIDMTKFVETPGYPSADEAAYEAIRQNPMARVSVEDYRVSGNNLYVNYRSTAKEDQTQVDKLADEAISAAITEGMSDTEKVTAINKWIVENMEYDYQALAAIESSFGRLIEDNQRYSDARGGLIDKRVICGGYADTFNLLARKAGLESIYVSGIIADSGSGHAWNHVKVDGEWKAIDTTWNDTDDITKYLLINEADFTGVAERSTKDSGWIVPMYQGEYTTP